MENGYSVNVSIVGIAPILQHAFTENQLTAIVERAKKNMSAPDYALEWFTTMYVSQHGEQQYICQPASHIESAMLKAAGNFKITGKRGKTYRDAVQAYCYVTPTDIIHRRNGRLIEVPELSIMDEPANGLSVSVMRVKVQRAAVARSRLMVDPGWQLDFGITVIEDTLRPDVLADVLSEAGRAVGIGDYRPRYGRFQVARFEVES